MNKTTSAVRIFDSQWPVHKSSSVSDHSRKQSLRVFYGQSVRIGIKTFIKEARLAFHIYKICLYFILLQLPALTKWPYLYVPRTKNNRHCSKNMAEALPSWSLHFKWRRQIINQSTNTLRSVRQGSVLQQKVTQRSRLKGFRELLALHRVVKEIRSKEATSEQKNEIKKWIMGLSGRLYWENAQPLYTTSRWKAWSV